MTVREQDYDVCIIGAGVAGALGAYRLGRAGVKVVLLEAGPRHQMAERPAYMQRYLSGDDPWASENPPRDVFTNAGAEVYPLNDYRVKGVGGTTLHWSGYTPRFHESDFQMKSRYGIAEDWPITYGELEPYYCEAEAELGVAGVDDNPFGPPRSQPYPLPGFPISYAEQKLHQAGKALSIKFHTSPQARTSISYRGRPACMTYSTCRVCPIGAKYSADAHVVLAEATGNVTVIPEANVVRLEVDSQKRVRRAIYASSDKVEQQASAKFFVLAANAVESARLLLLSTSAAFPHGLANTSGLVGKYFMEHRDYDRLVRVDEPLFPFRSGFSTIHSEQFYDKPTRDREAAFLLWGQASGPQPPRIAREAISRSGNWGEALEEELRGIVQEEFGRFFRVGFSLIEPLPVEMNRVELDHDVHDYFGNPCPKIFYAITDYEQATLQIAEKLTTDLFTALKAQPVSDYRLTFGGHQSGTCRMGRDPQRSIVDRNLCTHDVANLFIVGSSVFPTIGAVSPTLTIAALSLRLADHLLSRR